MKKILSSQIGEAFQKMHDSGIELHISSHYDDGYYYCGKYGHFEFEFSENFPKKIRLHKN